MRDKDKSQDQLIAEMHTDIKWLKDFMEGSNKKFAAKWTEYIVSGFIGLVMLSVMGALIATVVIAAEWIIQ